MTARPEQESETPRTDAACVSREYIAREMDHYTQKFVLADFARQLERELARSNALYEQVILGQRQLQAALTARERDALEQFVKLADTVRLRYSDRYRERLDSGQSEMGNVDWGRIEGAAAVVMALRSRALTPSTGGS